MSDLTSSPASETLGLGADFAANKAEPTAELSGHSVVLTVEGVDTEYVFDSPRSLRWRNGDEPFHTETYEALKPRDGLYVLGFANADSTTSAVEVALDLVEGRALVLQQRLASTAPGVPAVVQVTELASVSGSTIATRASASIEQTDELTGVRALWEYSANDIYEHIYLNSEWYVWHCLAGEEFPLADTDPCRVYKLRDGIYALTFSEKILTMGALMVLDFDALRSYCAAFGSENEDDVPNHFLFGAYGRVLSRTVYPKPLTAREGATE